MLDDFTAVHLAVNEGHSEILKILIENNADLEAETSFKRRPIHIACLRGHKTVAKLLLEANIEINSQDKEFYTPLHYASENGHYEIVNLIFQKKGNQQVNLDLENYQGMKPFDICCNFNVKQVFNNFISFDNKTNSYGRIQMGNTILNNGRVDHVQKMLKSVYLGNQNKKKISTTENQINENKEMFKVSEILIHDYVKEKKNKIGNFQEVIGPDSFNYHKLLGKGSFGEVYLVEQKSNGKLFAMKVLKKSKIFSQNLIKYAKTEKNVLSIMNHPFIVKLNYAYQNNTKLFMVMTYCPSGDMGRLLMKKRKFTEDVARIYASEILLALEHLHKNAIVFRDLKPDNVVIDEEGHVLLTDFGLAKEGKEDQILKSFCGSVAYLSPEILNRTGHNRTVDWYLFGVFIYELLVGIPPYYSNNRDQLFENIKRGPLVMPRRLSDDAKDLIKRLLQRIPQFRLGAKNDAEDIKSHPWFKNIDWKAALRRELKPPFPDTNSNFKVIDNLDMKFSTLCKTNEEKGKFHIKDWSFVCHEEESIL